ncbi:putative porin [Tellurirhabdus rosea]|uniref:putative porin n=1 Tax=Tellurirhabdus rosea TaxID=2674997 RepID=UPI002255DE01|nr:putative porin [Tellurirhabdus rosea]
MFRILRILLILISCSQAVQAQFPTRLPGGLGGGSGGFGGRSGGPGAGRGSGGAVIDDSTKMIYGPRTTRFFLESDLLYDRQKLYTVDTTIEGTHRYSFVQASENLLVDLGNLGTPLRPVFYETPVVGTRPGLNAFGPYAYQTQQIRYFDTKSPFTNMYYVAGGRDQNILRFEFTQNLNPRLNLGFNIQRFTSDVQFGQNAASNRNQRLAENWAFVFHGNYRSKDKKYTLLAHYSNLNHRLVEQGGLAEARFDSLRDIYDGPSILPAGVNSSEKRNDLHLYQQYVVAPGFQAYHTIDVQGQHYQYRDEAETFRTTLTDTVFNFYRLPGDLLVGQTPFDSSAIRQDTRFLLVENQFGIKGTATRGRLKGFNYRAWIRPRVMRLNGQFNLNRLQDSTYRQNRFENFIGGWLGYYFPDSLSRVTVEAEYSVARDFRLKGQLETKLITAGYESVFASPTLLQERFVSNVMRWNNPNLGLRGTQHAYGQINLRVNKLVLQPGLDYYLLTNYIYFDTLARPRQLSGAFSILRTGLGLRFTAGKFAIVGQGYYTVVSRDDVIRIPRLFANLRLQQDFLYAKRLFLQAGVDVHYKSSYFADWYMPLTQQYFLQNRFELPPYLVGDVFVNARINRVRLFVKFSHVAQGFVNVGDFTAPYFHTMRRAFGFGVHWLLFD